MAIGSAPPRGSGPVNVLYAGSLVDLMEKQIGPAFKAARGYRFNGFYGGSTALELAYSGADLKAVVTFHAALPVPEEEQARVETGP